MDPDVATGIAVGQFDVALEHEHFVVAQHPAGIGRALPVGRRRFDMKLRRFQAGNAFGPDVLEPRPGQNQFDPVLGIPESGRELAEGIVELRVGHGQRRGCAAVGRQQPSNAQRQHQRQTGREHDAPGHPKRPCQASSRPCPARMVSHTSRTAPCPPGLVVTKWARSRIQGVASAGAQRRPH